MKLFKTTQIYGLDVIDDNNKKKERVEGRRDSTQCHTRVKTGQMTATDVTSAGFETGQFGTASPISKPGQSSISANRAISKLDLAIWQAPVLKPKLLYGP
jgi:hypothetical protein